MQTRLPRFLGDVRLFVVADPVVDDTHVRDHLVAFLAEVAHNHGVHNLNFQAFGALLAKLGGSHRPPCKFRLFFLFGSESPNCC